jgi:hypothetical protein
MAGRVRAPGPDRVGVREDVPVAEPVEGSVTERDPVEGPSEDPETIDRANAAPSWRRPRWLAILGGAIA